MQYFFIFPVVLCSHIVHPVFLSWWASFSILFWILYWVINLYPFDYGHFMIYYLILLFGIYSVVSAFNLIVSCLSNSRQNSHLSQSWKSGDKQDESSHFKTILDFAFLWKFSYCPSISKFHYQCLWVVKGMIRSFNVLKWRTWPST